MEHPRLYKEETVSHTVRLSKELDERMLFRAQQKHQGSVQAYLTSLVRRDVELSELPDCNTCGFKAMGEFIILKLREGR